MYFKLKKSTKTPQYYLKHWVVFLIILLTSQIVNSLVLFDEQPQNETHLWATSTPTISSYSNLTKNGEPVLLGTHAIAIEASNWTQAGLYIGQVPPENHTILEANIYRVAGSSGKLMFRRGNNWLKINLDETNNENWTLDGKPGNNDYSDNTWHTLRINLGGFGLDEDEKIIAIGIQGPAATGYFYMDKISFVSDEIDSPKTPPIDGQWNVTFEDDFTGSNLDYEKWKLGQQYLDMSGVAGNSSRNIKIENEILTLSADKRPLIQGTKAFDYASTAISTYRNFRQQYGYFEAKIKYDAVQGVWPAFWLMPDRGNYGDSNYQRQAFLRFNLNNIEKTISSAILKIKIANANSNSSIAIHRTLTTDWSEESVTWASKPEIDPQWFIQQFGKVTNEIIEVDVTDYIQAQKNIGEDASFAIVDNYMKSQLMEIFSKEANDQNDRPTLIVNGYNLNVSDDTYVRGGENANTNYNQNLTLKIKDTWGNTSSTYDGGMEFDIMESLGIWGDDVSISALHWDGYAENHQTSNSEKNYFSSSLDGFHIYGMHWAPGYVSMYIDNEQVWSYTNERVGNIASYIILSLQVGGWDGNGTIIDDDLPAKMLIDYVRVWKDVNLE